MADFKRPLGIVGLLLSIILAPIAAALIQMAISRSREYAADARGAQLAGSPLGLINALKKLEVGNRQIPMDINPAQNHMFIVMRLSGGSQGLMDLFRTHPPTEKRIAHLLTLMNHPNPYPATT